MDVAKINTASYTRDIQAVKNAADSGGEINFSELLSETLEQSLVEGSIAMSNPSEGGTAEPPISSAASIQSMILGAAATGEASDAETAIFMLCLMMQNGESKEMSMLMSMMSSMLTQLKGDVKPLRDEVMGSGYDPYILDTIDSGVFGNTYDPDLSKGTVLPAEAWRPTAAAVTSDEGDRSPGRLNQVISQFEVETAERYLPYRRGNDTYCNIYVWDVTSALGCEIPHYADKGTGGARTYPDTKGAYELDANGVCDWLASRGRENGWREVSAGEAQAYANSGKPAVTAWKNPSGKAGHVQIVCPSNDMSYDKLRGVTVSQAGRENYRYTYLSSAFSQSQRGAVKYYVHE
ncbi:MAG: hypothetical protein LBL09_03740 [Oscillospiraceae bacterium]|jgi:hypothetical protein|nr:hypothetical protein [Oscillospiraceae bacterium]